MQTSVNKLPVHIFRILIRNTYSLVSDSDLQNEEKLKADIYLLVRIPTKASYENYMKLRSTVPLLYLIL